MARFEQKKQIELTVASENHSSEDEARTSAAAERKLFRRVAVGFGLLCVLQAALNISLRLFLYNQTQQDKAVCEIVTEPDELRNVSNQLFQEGWVYFRSSFYYISLTKKTWQESRDDCLSRGADLTIIDSQEEQDFLRRISKRMWIGLTERAQKGTWRWVDGTLLNTSYWFPGEPNDDLGREENCAETNFGDVKNNWNDWPCDYQNHWICEKKVAP
ncbi:CD209 antigen-like protein C [Salarias fasciatus]|uniref:CD209 antigen-like protein C n=1 Tax=Salarias fasciatus TaxID=181472 RepID=A0A672HWX1_SALFA|nr:CD209 antigen-like protein C [Salarias fasciatus]